MWLKFVQISDPMDLTYLILIKYVIGVKYMVQIFLSKKQSKVHCYIDDTAYVDYIRHN